MQKRKTRLYLHPHSRSSDALRNGTLAQLVEQRTENPCVPGSIPGGTTNHESDYVQKKKKKKKKLLVP